MQIQVESGRWNQFEDDMQHTTMPWSVDMDARRVAFDALDLAWCVLSEFGCTEDTVKEGELEVLIGILIAVDDDFMQQVRRAVFEHYSERVTTVYLRDAIDEFLSRQRGYNN